MDMDFIENLIVVVEGQIIDNNIRILETLYHQHAKILEKLPYNTYYNMYFIAAEHGSLESLKFLEDVYGVFDFNLNEELAEITFSAISHNQKNIQNYILKTYSLSNDFFIELENRRDDTIDMLNSHDEQDQDEIEGYLEVVGEASPQSAITSLNRNYDIFVYVARILNPDSLTPEDYDVFAGL